MLPKLSWFGVIVGGAGPRGTPVPLRLTDLEMPDIESVTVRVAVCAPTWAAVNATFKEHPEVGVGVHSESQGSRGKGDVGSTIQFHSTSFIAHGCLESESEVSCIRPRDR